MNYIKKLQSEVLEKDQEVQKLEDIIQEVVIYLNSDKFTGEGELQGYVNVKDILLRLRKY